MKKARLILTTSMFALMGLSAITFSSCTKDDKVCGVGLEGKDCDQEVRTKYFNTYRGDGSDSEGNTYTDWALKFSSLGTDAKNMKMNVMDNNDVNIMTFNVALLTNTSFEVEEKVDGQSTWNGQGTIDANTASLTLTEKDESTGTTETYIYNFTNMTKE